MRISAVADLRNEILAYYGLSVEWRNIESGGVRTFCLVTGSGPPLVMLHGAGGGGVLWAPVIDRLRRHFRLIIPDIIGYGESDKPDGSYDRRFFAGWLRGFMEAMGVKRAGLVGNSQGGAIAAQFAMDHADRTARLVLVCPAGLLPLRVLGWSAIVAMIHAQLFVSKRAMLRLARHLVYDPTGFPMDSAARYLEEIAGMPGGRRPFINGRGRAVRPFRQRELDRVQCPTLVLWGAEDRIIRPDAESMNMLSIAGATTKIMQRAGHTPFIDQPALFARHLVEFLCR